MCWSPGAYIESLTSGRSLWNLQVCLVSKGSKPKILIMSDPFLKVYVSYCSVKEAINAVISLRSTNYKIALWICQMLVKYPEVTQGKL